MSTECIEEMVDEQALRHLLDNSEDFDLRRQIRARLRQLKKESSPATETEKEKPKSYDTSYIKYQRSTPIDRPSKPVEQKDKQNGHREFLDKSSHLRSVKTDATTRPSSMTGGAHLEKVVLRNSPKTEGSKRVESSGARLEQVVLRKVGNDPKSTTTESPRLRPNAMTTKGAFQKFKEMDLTSDAGKRYLDAGDGASRRRSPSPNSIREQMLEWCRARVCHYDIEIDDFSSSWNDGMAFCALIHSFYPQAFDYDMLDREDKAKNFQLAFDTAEKLADVVPLLDVEDMIRTDNPDWKCVFTYVNSIANRMSEIRREKKNAEMLEREKELKKEEQNELEKEEQNYDENEQNDSD